MGHIHFLSPYYTLRVLYIALAIKDRVGRSGRVLPSIHLKGAISLDI